MAHECCSIFFPIALGSIKLFKLFIFILVSQDMASEMKNEIAQQLLDLNVSTFSMMPVKVRGTLTFSLYIYYEK